jgi:hypothetical protein
MGRFMAAEWTVQREHGLYLGRLRDTKQRAVRPVDEADQQQQISAEFSTTEAQQRGDGELAPAQNVSEPEQAREPSPGIPAAEPETSINGESQNSHAARQPSPDKPQRFLQSSAPEEPQAVAGHPSRAA